MEEVLQWGRVLMNAEGWAADLHYALCDELQWGRVLTNAEGSAGTQRATRCTCGFNGAALVRTRKGMPNAHYRAANWLLQWGRVLLNAEGYLTGGWTIFTDSFNRAAFL